jgi:PspC domain-containing protein
VIQVAPETTPRKARPSLVLRKLTIDRANTGINLVLVRVLWLGIALCTGVGFLVYLAAWIVIPSDYGFETGYAAGTNVAQTS